MFNCSTFYYITPTPSEAIEPIVGLVTPSSIKEFCAPTHGVLEGGIPVLLTFSVRELIAPARPVCAIATTLPAVAVESLSFSIIEVLIIGGIASTLR